MTRTIVFDVNETLSDMAPLAERFDRVGASPELCATWFAATLRDGFALAVHGQSARFADVARGVLLGLFRHERGLTVRPEAAAEEILAGFAALDVHPDVAAGVGRLKSAGHRLVTLSNGSASVAESLLGHSGLTDAFDLLLSVEDAQAWKPHPSAYRYAAQRCGARPDELVMVAVHPWDLDGAHRAGLTTVHLDRTGAPWPTTFVAPDLRVDRLADLATILEP